MEHRERYFGIVGSNRNTPLLFAPDITDWYLGNKREPGKELKYPPGSFIPDDDEIKNFRGTMPSEFSGMSLMDIYKKYDWGFHAHIYTWYDIEYSNGITKKTYINGNEMQVVFETPNGNLKRLYKLAIDGSWCPVEYLVKNEKEFEILFDVIKSQKYILREDNVKSILDGISSRGQGDLVISRSPFGKLVHEYLGFEETVYFMTDDETGLFEIYMNLQTEKDMELINLACKSIAKLVIISDHADETLISPVWYRDYCIPFYKQATSKLHEYGKIVSTHLDGNIKGLMPLFKDTGFDVLDGCTPAPMFNYEPEELAAALPSNMSAFVGVPSAMFCDNTKAEDIINYAKRIIKAFDGRAIINVGDILPANGDINKVIALGEFIKTQ